MVLFNDFHSMLPQDLLKCVDNLNGKIWVAKVKWQKNCKKLSSEGKICAKTFKVCRVVVGGWMASYAKALHYIALPKLVGVPL